MELERAEARLGRLEADRLGQEQEIASRHAQIDHERTGGNVARAAELAKMLLRDRHEMRFPLVGEVVGRWSALEELAGEEELPIVCSLMDVRTPVRVAWKADGDRAEYPFNVAKLYLAHKGAGNVTIKWEASVILRRERQPEEVVWAGPGTNKTLRREDSPMALPVDVPFRLWAGLPSSRLLGDGTVQAGTADLWLRVVCTEQKQSDGRRPRRTVVEVPFSIQVFGVERKSP